MDPITTTALVSAGADLIGGLFSQNRSLGESKRNREFQERMRNTQWQATVEDMRLAGINPAVAYSRGPNASPSGSTASVPDLPPVGSSAIAAKTAMENLELIRAQRRATDAQALKTRFESDVAHADSRMANARIGYYFNPDYTMRKEMRDLLESEFSAKIASNAGQVWDSQNRKFSLSEARALSEMFDNLGAGGKGVQTFMPLILSILRSQR